MELITFGKPISENLVDISFFYTIGRLITSEVVLSGVLFAISRHEKKRFREPYTNKTRT